MTMPIGPLHLLIHAVAGWMQRDQAKLIDFLLAEIAILRARLPAKRLVFTDDERRRLAARGYAVGRAALSAIVTLVRPDTILRWHRELVAAKWTTQKKGVPGRPGLMKAIGELIVQFAKENPLWGYKRIQGALENVGHRVCANTIGKTLRANGLDPAPERGKHTQWATFLKSHWEIIAAGDFFTTEVWTMRGLVTHYTLFVIDLATRTVQIVGTTPYPGAVFMKQCALLMTDPITGILRGKRDLILDNDTIFTKAFIELLKQEGVRVDKIPVRSPNCNAFAERFVRSIKHECLRRLIFVGASSLDRALAAYAAHYNAQRDHQGIGNKLIAPVAPVGSAEGRLVREESLGGILNFYSRRAA